jgi:phosphonate transport system permease protein
MPSASRPNRDVSIGEARQRVQLSLKEKLRKSWLYTLVFVALLTGSLYVSEFNFMRLIRGAPDFVNYFAETMPRIRLSHLGEDLSSWMWGLPKWLLLLVDTLWLAFAATALGGALAFLISFPASRNLAPSGTLYFVCRRILDVCRTVPEIVYALIFVYAFGLGPLPGVLAIGIHSAGSLGKLFSEVNENVDGDTIEGLRAAGGNWFQTVRYAVLPKTLPDFVSYLLLRFEINVRVASVVGFVGVGGIGQELYIAIRQFIYTDVSAILLLLILTVFLIDIGCENIRHRLIGLEFAK